MFKKFGPNKSEKTEKKKDSLKFWKLISYPLCVIMSLGVFAIVLGSVIPTINQYGYLALLYPYLNDGVNYSYNQAVYFPVFYCIDGILVYFTFKVVKFLNAKIVRIMNRKEITDNGQSN